MRNLRKIALSMANDKGKYYLSYWLKDRKIVAIYPTENNWFYIVVENQHSYAISQRSDCSSSTFGDASHLLRHLSIEEKNNVVTGIDTEKLKPCYSNITYLSERFRRVCSAVFVCFDDAKNNCYIQSSGEKIWIKKQSIYSII